METGQGNQLPPPRGIRVHGVIANTKPRPSGNSRASERLGSNSFTADQAQSAKPAPEAAQIHAVLGCAPSEGLLGRLRLPSKPKVLQPRPPVVTREQQVATLTDPLFKEGGLEVKRHFFTSCSLQPFVAVVCKFPGLSKLCW